MKTLEKVEIKFKAFINFAVIQTGGNCRRVIKSVTQLQLPRGLPVTDADVLRTLHEMEKCSRKLFNSFNDYDETTNRS